MTSPQSTPPLRLSPDAVIQCVAACDGYLEGLHDLHTVVANTDKNWSFGSLESARALGAKFGNLLNGDTGSLLSILEQHITVAEDLRETFRAAGRGYERTEAETTVSLTRTGN